MGIASACLLVVAAVPLGYFDSRTPRTIYAAVATPVAWVVYLLLLYFLVYRPMTQATDVFEEGDCIDEDGGVALITKEIHKLNRNVGSLIDEAADMRALTDALNSGAAGEAEDRDVQIMDLSEQLPANVT